VRKTNQDRFLLATINKRVTVVSSNLEEDRLPVGDERLAYLAMVADGVGGGTGGAEASAMTLETVMQYVNDSLLVFYGARADEAGFAELLQAAAMRAHEAVRQRRQQQGVLGTMATTLTLFFSIWPTYYLLQLGDSRYYLWRDGKLRQLTRDQTMAQDLVDEGVMTGAAAAKTPMANVLSRRDWWRHHAAGRDAPQRRLAQRAPDMLGWSHQARDRRTYRRGVVVDDEREAGG
jgi:protein phosphatase